MSVSHTPSGCNTVNAYLVVKDAKAAIDFYVKAFGGEGGTCLTTPDGGVMHGEVRIGNSTVMLTQENPQWQMKSAETLGGSPVSMMVYVEDCDAVIEQAIAAGATAVCPTGDMFWGDRMGKVADPFGLQWSIATHKEDVDDEEMQRRAAAWMAEMAQAGGQGQ